MKYWWISLVCLLGLTTVGPNAFAQKTWEEMLREQEERVKQKQQAQDQRVEIRFANQMRRMWLKRSFTEGEFPEGQDPDVPFVYEPANDIRETPEERQLDVVPLSPQSDVAPLAAKAAVPAPDVPEPVQDEFVTDALTDLGTETNASYFGESLELKIDPEMEVDLEGLVNEKTLALAWEQLEDSRYELLLYQITREAARLQVNDWGYAQMINQIAHQIFPSQPNERVVFSWFMLSKSGYISTVAYEGGHVYLMMPTRQILYGKTFLRNKDQKFYAIDLDGGDIDLIQARVFAQKYPEADRIMDLRMPAAPRLASRTIRKSVSFSYAGQNYDIPYELDANLLEFYKTYPFVDLSVYMSAPVSEACRNSLVASLKEAVADLQPTGNRSKEAESVNFLLRFVQTGLAYQTDHQQFGGEKYLFAEETLFFPYSDCEDRSVLFAYLVQEILGLEVIGLMYPGHAATAVKFSGPVNGDHVMFRNKKYTICDPTYINADYGMSLPETHGQMANVVAY
ncbi:hypothetical protein [Pontibacter sp. G13]|uniref:hypothetical protein n=1 Tax=Pontibacter sp. G13 TaxID=3074898 RepID=UPI00288BEF91|nr:hypothetical protein [Pontibacter sp. G13]WNJ20631.1 hypothetical protein RJD25_09115 [Pontibacter sp. G13]